PAARARGVRPGATDAGCRADLRPWVSAPAAWACPPATVTSGSLDMPGDLDRLDAFLNDLPPLVDTVLHTSAFASPSLVSTHTTAMVPAPVEAIAASAQTPGVFGASTGFDHVLPASVEADTMMSGLLALADVSVQAT